MSELFYIHPTAIAEDGTQIGKGTKVWHFCHIMGDASIGADCTVGQNVFVASGVKVGDHVKIQNNVSLYEGVELEEHVFCGPSCVFTNVSNPRSEIPRQDQYLETRIRRGATIGANATIVCGHTIGRYALIAAGAVVCSDIPDYALVMGVPGRVVGAVSRHGHRLEGLSERNSACCPESGWRYTIQDGVVRCLDWPEDRPLTEGDW